jgi:O-antigen ligase
MVRTRWVEPAALAALGAALVVGSLELAYRTEPLLPLTVFAAVGVVTLAWMRPVASVCLAIAAVPLEIFSLKVGAGGLSPPEALLLVSGWTWAARRLASGHPPFSPSLPGKPLALLLVAILPGIVVAQQPSAVLKVLLMWTSFLLVYQLIVAEAGPRDVQTILVVLAFSAAVVSAVAITKTAGHPQELLQSGTAARGRATGTFTQPNQLASFLALALGPALILAFSGPRALRPVAGAAALLGFAGVALSLSRGGAFAVFGCLLTLLLWPPIRRAALGALVVAAVIVGFGGNPLGNVQEVDTVFQRLSSVNYAVQGRSDPRFQIWKTAPEIFADHPLTGVGANQFSTVAPSYNLIETTTGEVYDHAHDVPLTIAAELGILGLLGWGWLVLATGIVAVRALRRRAGPWGALVVAVLASLVAVGLGGIVDYTVGSNVIGASVMILLACAVVLARANPGAAAPAGTDAP